MLITILALILAVLLLHALWLDHTLTKLARRVRELERIIHR